MVSQLKNKIRKIYQSMNEKPVTDPVYEIQRLLRVSGYKIKETTYDADGTANVKLAYSADIKDAMKYLESLDNLPANVTEKNGEIIIKSR